MPQEPPASSTTAAPPSRRRGSQYDDPEAVLLALKAAWDRETDWEDFGREAGEIIQASQTVFVMLRRA